MLITHYHRNSDINLSKLKWFPLEYTDRTDNLDITWYDRTTNKKNITAGEVKVKDNNNYNNSKYKILLY